MSGRVRIRRILHGLEVAFILLVTALTLVPFLWLIMTAFKQRPDILAARLQLRFSPTLGNFYEAFVIGDFGDLLVNSLLAAGGSTLLCMIIGVPAAFALSRYRIFGEKHLFFYVLTTRMAPAIALVLPLYMFFQSLGILNTTLAVVLAHATFNLALVVYLMRNFFNDIPRALDEAALIEGATEWQVFWNIVLPLTRPGLAVTAVLAFLFSWNEFLLALMIGGAEAQTLPAGFPGLVTPLGTYWGQLAAVSVVVSLPVLVLVWLVQRHLARGLTFGSVR